jgi:hypothetical protein
MRLYLRVVADLFLANQGETITQRGAISVGKNAPQYSCNTEQTVKATRIKNKDNSKVDK